MWNLCPNKAEQRKEVSFKILDGYGKLLRELPAKSRSGTFTINFNLGHTAEGTYYLQTTIGTSSFVEKIVVAR